MPRGTDMDAVVLPSTLEEELKHDLKDLSKLDKNAFERRRLNFVAKLNSRIDQLLILTEQYLKHTPREHKYVLAQRIRESTLNLAIFLVEAEKRFYSKTALNNLDIENAKLKRLWYVMFELWFLGYKHNQKYDHTIALHRFNTLSIKLGEIGRMIGGLYKFESVRHQ